MGSEPCAGKFFCGLSGNTTTVELINPTDHWIYRTGAAGACAEPVRPYFIGRKVGLPFSSQLAVWAVERIFDIGGFAILLISAIFLAEAPRKLALLWPFSRRWNFYPDPCGGPDLRARCSWLEGGCACTLVVLATFSSSELIVALRIQRISQRTEYDSQLQCFPSTHCCVVGDVERDRSCVLGESCAPMARYSRYRCQWFHCYGVQYGGIVDSIARRRRRRPVDVDRHAAICISLAGHELAASCGLLIWLITMVSVAPLGLVLAHRDRLSLRRFQTKAKKDGE